MGEALKDHRYNAGQMNVVWNKLNLFRKSLIKDVEIRISGMIDDVMQDVNQKNDLQERAFREFRRLAYGKRSRTWHSRLMDLGTRSHEADATNEQQEAQDYVDLSRAAKHPRASADRKLRLPSKVFIKRESYLTGLMAVDHIRVIYNLFCMILVWCFLNTITYDYFVEGKVSLGFGTFKKGLAKIHITFFIWILEHLFVAVLYHAFRGWANMRLRLTERAFLLRLWSACCIIIYIITQFFFIYIPTLLSLHFNLPFIPAAVLLLETLRLVMKMHAFVRSNSERVLWVQQNIQIPYEDKKSELIVAPFQHYMYFLFAPTLLYRNSYPRTKKIRWKFALSRFFEVVAIAFLFSFMYERIIYVHFANYGREELNASTLLAKIFGMVMPSVLILVNGFYMIMHSWLNFTAELLRFGDRMFYKDWWTANTYAMYFRNWNLVVHDWLYEYIYKDSYMHLFKGSKPAAAVLVFMVSAYAHEHVVGFALQLFFPMLFVFFGLFGMLFIFLTRTAPRNMGNIFLWFTLISGFAMIVSFYSMEYYAKVNCKANYGYWIDYVIPAAWRCYYM